MRLQEWEETIREITDECSQVQTIRGENKILTKWRAKLGKEPSPLEPFQIDKIVREVRRRLSSAGR
jgi:hypothetical protein